MDSYNKLFMIIRKTDLLNYDEKNELQLYLMNLKQQVKKQKEVIDNVIKCIEKEYYSKNTTDINSIKITTNKLLQIGKMLKEVSE